MSYKMSRTLMKRSCLWNLPGAPFPRVLTNQRLNLIAGTEITSNVPKAWFLALVENRQEGKGNGIPNLIIIKDFFVFKRILSRHYFSLLGCPRMNSCRERKWNTKKHTKIMFESDPMATIIGKYQR